MSKNRWLKVLALLSTMAWLTTALARAESLGQTAADGQAIFTAKCVSCHTIGQGTRVGPDLQGVSQRREAGWLSRWISAPDQMLSAGDPIATALLPQFNNVAMPNLGLTESEVAALIAYFQAIDRGELAAPQVPAAALPAGDPAAGKALFTGSRRLQNGGPPCLACHSIEGIGALGGGALGPDLTQAYSKLGEALILWPESRPPMQPIFAERPLSNQEKANLLAFVQAASLPQRSAGAIERLALFAVGGLAVMLLGAHLLWRRRLAGVRQPLLKRA